MSDHPAPPPLPNRPELVLITGISGSGKSVALRALEDAGFYCIDNLPPELLGAFVALETAPGSPPRRVAIAMDVRAAHSLCHLGPGLAALRGRGTPVQVIFLDARTEALVRRYAETRRRHPLSRPADPAAEDADTAHRALVDAIELERELLAELRESATVIDTSLLAASQLRARLRQLVDAPPGALSLAFESFAFKAGVPLDADLVFDLRVLPNPHYEAPLRALTGRDAPVADWLQAQPEVREMHERIADFLRRWLPDYARDQRASLTVAIGCTGGQHRSVHAAEQLAARFRAARAAGDPACAHLGAVLLRHRELDRR